MSFHLAYGNHVICSQENFSLVTVSEQILLLNYNLCLSGYQSLICENGNPSSSTVRSFPGCHCDSYSDNSQSYGKWVNLKPIRLQ
ncbi:unnamed protein product, partial [Candidula unifasciata]